MAMHEYKVSLVIYQTDSMAHGLCEVTTHLRSHSSSSDFGEDEWWMMNEYQEKHDCSKRRSVITIF